MGNLGQTQSLKRVGFVWYIVCLFIFCLIPHVLFLMYVARLSELEAASRRHLVLSSGKIIQHEKALHGGGNHTLKCFQKTLVITSATTSTSCKIPESANP